MKTRLIDTIEWTTLLSIVPMLDKSTNESVQRLVTEIVCEVTKRLFEELPVAEEEKEEPKTSILQFPGVGSKPN